MERRLGDHLPVSIATARALESLFGIGEDFPDAKTEHVDKVWVSLRTLVRNAYDAYSTEDRRFLTDMEVTNDVKLDISVMEEIISTRGEGRIGMTVYLCAYNSLSKQYPKAIIRQANTDLQKSRLAIENAVLTTIKDEANNFDFRQCDIKFDGPVEPRTAMITHLPIDLLNQYHFKTLYMLESHSGGFKNRLEWGSRLYGIGGDASNIPFNKAMLQIFGDSNMFSPMPIKLRRYVIEMADRYKWTATTSKDYIMKCVEKERDPVLEGLFHRLW
jgi:hypothetical protein